MKAFTMVKSKIDTDYVLQNEKNRHVSLSETYYHFIKILNIFREEWKRNEKESTIFTFSICNGCIIDSLRRRF